MRRQAWLQFRLRFAFAVVVALLAIVGPLSVDAAHAAPGDQGRKANDDDVVVNGRRVADCSARRGSATGIDYGCLNSQLKAAARDGQPVPPVADRTTSQADVPSRVGTFSYSATRQRMGSNFGRSAQPYRPPALNYANAITARGPK